MVARRVDPRHVGLGEHHARVLPVVEVGGGPDVVVDVPYGAGADRVLGGVEVEDAVFNKGVGVRGADVPHHALVVGRELTG
jgi:hypothetical protein